MKTVTKVAKALQTVFGTKADELGYRCGVIRRRRKWSGSTLAQTLVFGWLNNPKATFDELAQCATLCGAHVSSQAVEQRIQPETAGFLQQLLGEAVRQVVASEPVALPLLTRFEGVFLQDSTLIALPDPLRDVWRGSGGCNGQSEAAVKLQLRVDWKTGRLSGPYLQDGRASDRRSPLEDEELPPGALRVADLGYFDLYELARLDARGVFFLSRIQPQTAIFDEQGKRLDLPRRLAGAEGPLDLRVRVGQKQPLRSRLLATRVPTEVVCKRRERLLQDAQRRGRPVSRRQWNWCRWTVMITNVPAGQLTLAEALVILRTRWQIELLFKLWKQEGRLHPPVGAKPWRILVELYAKLLGLIVQHWLLLATCWRRPDRSLPKAAAAIRRHAPLMLADLSYRRRLLRTLRALTTSIAACARINKRRKRPSNFQLLLHPELLAP